MDISREVIEKIVEMSAPNFHKEGGYAFSDKKLIPVDYPAPDAVELHTLKGLVAIIKGEHKAGEVLVVQVESPTKISAYGPLREDESRRVLYTATPVLPPIVFDHFIPVEEMIIMLRSRFIENDDVLSLLAAIGNMRSFNAKKHSDNGVTQEIAVLEGIETTENVAIEPIRRLMPYRTFPEVEQPMSDFLFRLKEDPRTGICAALFEADGGRWRVRAADNLTEYLTDELEYVEGVTVVQ